MADISTSEAAPDEGHPPSKPRRLYLERVADRVVPCRLAGTARALSDRGTLGGLTQFLTQFDVSGSATGP